MTRKNDTATPATTTPAPAVDPAVEQYRAEMARREAARAEARAAREAARAAGGPQRNAAGRLTARGLPCLCGCGHATTTRDARFLSGHDARLRSQILKGGLDAGLIPEIARPFFAEGPVAGLLLADAGTEAERLVDVKNGGWA